MKARIKKTGEIVNIAEYVKITNSWGNTIEVKPEEVELIQEQTVDEHWQMDDVTDWNYYRIHAAITAMQGIMDFFSSLDYNKETIARLAVEQADTLIAELKKK